MRSLTFFALAGLLLLALTSPTIAQYSGSYDVGGGNTTLEVAEEVARKL